MSKKSVRKEQRKPANLYLSDDAREKLQALKKALSRPSESNVVEFLIQERAARLLKAA